MELCTDFGQGEKTCSDGNLMLWIDTAIQKSWAVTSLVTLGSFSAVGSEKARTKLEVGTPAQGAHLTYCPLSCSCHCIHPSETPREQHTAGCKPDLQTPQLQLQLAQSTGSGLNMSKGAQQHGAAILAAEQWAAASIPPSTRHSRPKICPISSFPASQGIG